MTRRTRQALLRILDEHIGFLERSNAMYDLGHESEAKRLAVSLRVLFQHSAESPNRTKFPSYSLMRQLDPRDSLKWVATAGIPDPTNMVSTPGLVNIEMSDRRLRYHAPLNNRPPSQIKTGAGTVRRGGLIPFKSWWNDPVLRDPEGITEFSRKNLVLALCNQEGGAHVDPNIKESYDKLANNNSMGFGYLEGEGPPIPLSNPVLPSIRQISYEVLESIRQQRELIG